MSQENTYKIDFRILTSYLELPDDFLPVKLYMKFLKRREEAGESNRTGKDFIGLNDSSYWVEIFENDGSIVVKYETDPERRKRLNGKSWE